MSDTQDTRTLAAARWLAAQHEQPAHVVPALKEHFGLTGLQACQAIALARDMPTPRRPTEIGLPSDGEGKV
jgi:hypothetical protein